MNLPDAAGQSGPSGQLATWHGAGACGFRALAASRSIQVAPGSSILADWSRMAHGAPGTAASSSQEICWVRRYTGGMPRTVSIDSTTEVHEPVLA